jgi:hypothetical protein
MPKKHEVQQGECLASIALQYGLTEKKIWNHGDNAALKSQRKDPNVLYPGDVLTIPDITVKEVGRRTGARHNFVRKDVPAKFKVRLMSDDEPRANEKYTLEIDGGVPIEGVTDGDGRIEKPIKPDAKVAKLTLKDGNEVYMLQLGQLDPLDTPEGVMDRLTAMGYPAGDSDEWTEEASAALKKFQYDHDLAENGDWKDEPTKNKLKEVFGS